MLRISSVFLFLFFIASFANAATISYELKKDSIDFIISFQSAPSNITMLKGDKNIVFNFETAENVEFKRQDFFDLPIKSAYISGGDSFRKKFIVTFENTIIEPKVNAIGNTVIISFPIAAELLAAPLLEDNITATPKKAAVPGTGSYFRMMFGLIIVLAVILGLYWLLKTYLKKQIFSDIPGSGRLLGKVDLDIRKSLYFYEIADIIYIIGVTDSAMTLIDKVSNDEDMTKIKTGLAKKHEFSGYMSFFGRRNRSALEDDMSVNNTLVEERIKSLRKK